jgi:hypothetical protein
MTTIEDQKTDIFTELSLIPSSVVLSRKDVVDKSILATAMRDDQAPALTTLDYQQTGEELGNQRTLLKSGDLINQIKFNFQALVAYQEALGFDLPQVDQFGYTLIDNAGNVLPLNDTSSDLDSHINNFYLVKNIATQELVSIDDDLTAFSGPQFADTIVEFVQTIETESSNLVATLANQPIVKTDPTASVTIFASDFRSSDSEVQIGSTDSAGAVTSITNSQGIVLDESASIMDYNSKTIDLTFSILPSVETVITVKYDYISSSNTASENHTDFGRACSRGFSRTLSNIPVPESIEVFLNGVKKAITNTSGKIYSMGVVLADSFYTSSSNEVRVRFSNVTSESGNTVRFDYTIKDEDSATEDIGTLVGSSIVIPNFVPANTEIILESVRILDGTTEIATSDSTGVITGNYTTATGTVDSGVITGTISDSTGLDLVFTAESGGQAEPLSDITLNLQYDITLGLPDWDAIYDKVVIQSLSTNGNGVRFIHIDSGEIVKAPSLLKTYPLKKFSDHQIYGNVVIVTEGLEINTDWLPVYIRNDGVISAASSDNDFVSADFAASGFTDDQHAGQTLRIYDYNSLDYEEFTIASHTGATIEVSDISGLPVTGTGLKFEVIWPAEDATKFSDAAFEAFMTWLDPARQYLDDILKSSNPNNVSRQSNTEDADTAAIILDKGPNGLDGSMTSEPVFGRGQFSNSMKFDGVLKEDNSTNYIVTVPDNTLLSPSEITVEFWMKPENLLGSTGNTISKNADSEWRVRFNNDNQTITFFDRGFTNPLTTIGTIPYRKWTHVACTADSSGIIIYINGILNRSGGSAYGAPNTSGDLYIGAANLTVQFFKGWATEFRVWDYVRTVTQILEFKDKELVGDETGLVGYWRTNGANPYIEVDPFFPRTD